MFDRRWTPWLGAGVSLFLIGCADDSTCGDACAPAGNEVHMDFTHRAGFYAAPFPSDDRKKGAAIDLDDFPNPTHAILVRQSLEMIKLDVHGFSATSSIYFELEAALGKATLPDYHSSVAKSSPVFLVGVDEAALDFGKRYPVDVQFKIDGGPYGTKNQLSLLPLQGVPLRPKTRYAAVVMKSLAGADGTRALASASMNAILSGRGPEGMSDDARDEYVAALGALEKQGVDTNEIAALTVFTTDAPTEAEKKVLAAMVSAPLPEVEKAFSPNEVFDGYCVFSTTIPMPDYQAGKSPYSTEGEWIFDSAGEPVMQERQDANFVVTVPRARMPANGFPIVIFSRTGGGGDRPLVDRGVQAMTGGPPITPGTGPAMYFAMAGFAGASIDGPLGGLRNSTHGNEDFLIFNTSNPRALRDNIRQSAAELGLAAHILAATSFDASSCPGFEAPHGIVKFDGDEVVLMGHSMGATISPLSIATESKFKAVILSGAGGSWIENVIYKKSPMALKGISEILLGIQRADYGFDEHDPALNLFQWAEEPADPPLYARDITLEPPSGTPRHVLMEQGIVDTYILPSIADATSLSIGLDLGGKELDQDNPKIAEFTPVGTLLDLVGRKNIALPAELNVSLPHERRATALFVQHPQDDVEDGHEIVFQTDPPKREYVCFLRTLLLGTPRVPDDDGPVGTCD
jgi:hypothetical protein